jgi:hypothetical protein
MAQERMPQLEGAIILGADHIAAMAKPEDVNARIIGFLRRDMEPPSAPPPDVSNGAL